MCVCEISGTINWNVVVLITKYLGYGDANTNNLVKLFAGNISTTVTEHDVSCCILSLIIPST